MYLFKHPEIAASDLLLILFLPMKYMQIIKRMEIQTNTPIIYINEVNLL